MITKLSSDIVRKHKGISFVGVTTWFFCHDGNGEFVLAKRSKNARDEHGRWEIGGGGLKIGVAAEDNVKREIKEEYGADTMSVNFLGYRDLFRKLDDGTPTHWLALDFSVLVDRKQIKNNEPEIFDELGWFTLKNLPSPLHSQWPTYFKKYNKTIKQILNGNKQ